MSKVLVVVDMQPDFSASRGKKIIKEHIRQIHNARKNNHHIVILEYKDCGDTYLKIKKALRDYPLAHYLTKTTCSGSYKLTSFFKKKEFWPKEISFMGVNTDECVKHTVLNFHYHIKRHNKPTKIKVIREACKTDLLLKGIDHFKPFVQRGIEVI